MQCTVKNAQRLTWEVAGYVEGDPLGGGDGIVGTEAQRLLEKLLSLHLLLQLPH